MAQYSRRFAHFRVLGSNGPSEEFSDAPLILGSRHILIVNIHFRIIPRQGNTPGSAHRRFPKHRQARRANFLKPISRIMQIKQTKKFILRSRCDFFRFISRSLRAKTKLICMLTSIRNVKFSIEICVAGVRRGGK